MFKEIKERSLKVYEGAIYSQICKRNKQNF